MNTTRTSIRRDLRPSRLAIGVSALAGGLALLLTPIGASGQSTDSAANASAESSISISFTPSDVTGDCVQPDQAVASGTLVAYPSSDASTFKLTIATTAPICGEGLSADAVVYSMPANGDQWPQQLVEKKSVNFKAPGQTVITFAKGCDRVQYDVTVGGVPAVLNSGFDHQLLFPGNLETAFQHVGNGPNCVSNATSTTSTTAAPTTTTTAAPKVLSSTTVAPTTVLPAVLASTTVKSSSDPATVESASALATTGATSGPIALVGGGLVLIGVASLLASRRRTV